MCLQQQEPGSFLLFWRVPLDCCLVCAYSEAEQVWGVSVLLLAALYPSAAFSTTWGYCPLSGRGVEMSLPSRMQLASQVLGYGVVALLGRVCARCETRNSHTRSWCRFLN